MSQNTREGAKTREQRPKQGLVDTSEWTPSPCSLADNDRSAVPLTGASLIEGSAKIVLDYLRQLRLSVSRREIPIVV